MTINGYVVDFNFEDVSKLGLKNCKIIRTISIAIEGTLDQNLNQLGHARISLGELAKSTNISESTIKRRTKILEEKEIIVRSYKYHKYDRTYCYELNYEKLREWIESK